MTELTGIAILMALIAYVGFRLWRHAERERLEDEAMARDWQTGYGDET